MSTRTTSVADAVEHLPEGAMLVIAHATWDEYEQLLDAVADRPGLRVTYDRGRLEIMSPSAEHETITQLVLQLARVVADERGTPLEAYGATTWKRRSLRQGAEPDTCFYVGNAFRIIAKPRIDLETDPPPDVVVEIDITNESVRKFSVYAALGVPEIWRYDSTGLHFFELADGEYRPVNLSLSFPDLTPATLHAAIEQGRREGQTVALNAFRQRLRSR